MTKWFGLGLAGACGTLARYVLGGWIHQLLGANFPFGTFVVNVTGCLAVGFLGTLADEKFLLNSQLRLLLMLGFLGAFTTFSSFAYETWTMLQDGELWFATLNIFGSVLACFLGLVIGVFTARLL